MKPSSAAIGKRSTPSYSDPEHYEFDEQWLEKIEELQPPGRELSYGFYYKEQVY